MVSSIVLASLGSSGRLTVSAARTDVVLLIRRTVRPSTYIIKNRTSGPTAAAVATGKTRVLARWWLAGCTKTILNIL